MGERRKKDSETSSELMTKLVFRLTPPCRPELVSGPQDSETSSALTLGERE